MNRKNWRLRAATKDDLPALTALLEEAGLPAGTGDTPVDDAWVVAESDGVLIGAGAVEVRGAYGLLRSVVVHPEFRGRGIGGAMVNDRLRWSATRRIRALYLLATAAPDFFERAGFDVTSRTDVPVEVTDSDQFAGGCPADATAMVLRIEPLG
jgi:amino-acid N-acetyltransferase